MNKTKIEWCDYTWNPVVGCKRDCSYCYAKKINDRFKYIPEWTEPQFYLERLKEKAPKKPSKIFVGSMTDICYWKAEWKKRVILYCHQHPQHTFMFLTKDTTAYLNYDFPDNCWLGVTVTDPISKAFVYYYKLIMKKRNKKFVSVEPILWSFSPSAFNDMDLVIVGAMTGPGAIKPEKEWIESIKHKNIFYKDNIKKYL